MPCAAAAWVSILNIPRWENLNWDQSSWIEKWKKNHVTYFHKTGRFLCSWLLLQDILVSEDSIGQRYEWYTTTKSSIICFVRYIFFELQYCHRCRWTRRFKFVECRYCTYVQRHTVIWYRRRQDSNNHPGDGFKTFNLLTYTFSPQRLLAWTYLSSVHDSTFCGGSQNNYCEVKIRTTSSTLSPLQVNEDAIKASIPIPIAFAGYFNLDFSSE